MFLKTRFSASLLVLSFILFCIAAFFITYPLIFNLKEITSGFGDELIIAWIQNFIIHNPFNFNANIYFPYSHTLAYSDFLFTSSFSALLPLLILKEPIVVFNFTLISSLILLGFSIFLLSFYLTKNYFISVFTGFMVIFSPAVLDKKIHVQILGVEWVVFSILFFCIFINTNKTKYLFLSLIFFVLQVYNSFMPGYFILFFYLISLICLFFADRNSFRQKINRKNLLLLLTSLLITVPIVIPYLKVSQEFDYKRDIKESIHFALQPEDLLVSGDVSNLKMPLDKIFIKNNYPDNAEIKNGFIGLTFSILSIMFLVYFLKKIKRENIFINSFFLTGILGLVLSLGPLLHINRLTIHSPFPVPLPYLFFYYVFPGFNGFRNSARWEMLLIICFAAGIALMLNELLKKYSINKIIIICFFLSAFVIAEFNFPMKYYSAEKELKTPEVYSLFNENDNVIFLPICSWNDNCAPIEFKRDYYSIGGFPKTVNGVSGFSPPPPWEKLVASLNKDFPNTNSLKVLKDMNVKYIVYEKDTYDLYFPDGQPTLDRLRMNSSLKEIKRFDNTYVFEL